MTGVGDIIWAARYGGRRLISTVQAVIIAILSSFFSKEFLEWLLPRNWREEAAVDRRKFQTCPRIHLPDCRDTIRYNENRQLQSHQIIPVTNPSTKHPKWGLLIPLTSRGMDVGGGESLLWTRLAKNMNRLVESIPQSHREYTTVYIAIDMRDPVYDNDQARDRLRVLVTDIKVVFTSSLLPMFQGQLCWIWSLLAKNAVAHGADLFVLLGDDLQMLDNDWQSNIEQEFENIATERNLPYGCACVALQDISFECFPTFPVLHRFHLDVFGVLLPDEFRNQHGDPFLFEIYCISFFSLTLLQTIRFATCSRNHKR